MGGEQDLVELLERGPFQCLDRPHLPARFGGLGCGVDDWGSRIWGLGLMVWGLGFRCGIVGGVAPPRG